MFSSPPSRLVRHVFIVTKANRKTYFSVRVNHSMRSPSAVGMGKKQREWGEVNIGDTVQGTSSVIS